MVGIEQFAFEVIVSLVASAIQAGVELATLPYFQRRKIEGRFRDATAEVVEPLLPFLEQERVPLDKQRRLIQTCVDELRPLTERPELLFQGSLDGQKIFDDLYADRDLPQVVIEDDLKDVYALLCPRIATLLCKIPAAVKDWESEAWTENYRRLDEIVAQMRSLFIKVDEMVTASSREADATLTLVRRTLAQRIGLKLDLTGLRADQPQEGRFTDFFVYPELQERKEKNPRTLRTPDESFAQFTSGRYQAILIGPPGAGKSIWSKWLQRETVSDQWTGIGVRVALRGISGESLPSLQELVREEAGRHLAEELTPDLIRRWLDARQVVFILDGFDEIRPSERDKVLDWIVGLHAAAQGCPFVLTSRPLTTDHLDHLHLSVDWQSWTLEPFDEERIVDYIQRWYAHTPLLLEGDHDVDAAALAAGWRADPTIEPLTGNPLLLSTLLMVHHLDGSLPTGRSKLYQRYVEGMLGLWDDRRKVTATTVQLSLTQKQQILRGFALHMFLQGQDQLDEPATMNVVQELLQKMNVSLPVEDVLAALRERSGLIVGPGIYSFVHKSVAEYLVAEAILQGDQRDESGCRIDRFMLFEHREDDRWNTVTFLWAGLAPIVDVESFINECIEVETWDLAYGILSDQYERIPRETRRQLLLEGISKNQIPVEPLGGYYIYSHPIAFHLELEAWMLRLRGLSSFGHRDILDKARLDGALVWSDSVNAQGKIRDILWIEFSSPYRIQSIDEWKTCLASSCPEGGSAITWLFWRIEWALMDALRNKLSLALEVLVENFKEACPHARGLVPIALMSAGLTAITSNDDKFLDWENLLGLLEILPSSDDGEVLPDWLRGTREWILGMAKEPNENIGDLLTAFIEQMEKLAEQGMLNRDATYERAIHFVEELRERRESLDDLVVETGDSRGFRRITQ